MSAASFKLEIDWAGNGAFTASASDVTSRVRLQVEIQRGKDRQAFFSPPMAGLSGFDLDNLDKYLSPGYTSSPIHGLVLPGRRVRFTTTSPSRTLWTGYTDEIRQQPEWGRKSVGFANLGVLTLLRGKSISTPLYQNIRIDQAIGYVLDAIGWPAADRVLDTATVTLDSFVLDKEDAGSAILSLLLTEGPFASIYEDGQGRIVFEANDYRSTETRCTTSQATFSDTSTNVAFSYDPNYRDIVSLVRLARQARQTLALESIWTYPTTLTLTANQVVKFEVKAASGDPFINAQTPSVAPSSAVQTLAASTTLTSGTFALTFRGLTTTSLNYNATAAQIQSALEALSTIGSGNVLCDGGSIDTVPVTISFLGALAAQEIADKVEIANNALNPVSVAGSIEAAKIRSGDTGPFGSPLPELQSLTPASLLTGGTFTLTVSAPLSGYAGTTSSLNYNATKSQIQTAIRAIFGFGSTVCTGGPINTTQVTINFATIVENMDLTVVTPNALTTSVAGATITTTQNNMGGQPDYTLIAGSLLSKSLDRTSGKTCTLTLVAGSSGATLTGLRVRAQVLSILNTTYVSYPNDTLTDPLGLVYAPEIRVDISLTAAESLAQALYDRFHDSLPNVDIEVVTPLTDAAAVDAMFAREVSDRVTIVDGQTAISEDYWVERLAHTIDSGANLLRTKLGGVKVIGVAINPAVRKWRGLISQSGTNAPTAVVLQNDLGGDIVWSRSGGLGGGVGRYIGTLAGAFPVGRTLFFPNPFTDANSGNVAWVTGGTDDAFVLRTLDRNTGSFADGILASRPLHLEILVYPAPFASNPSGKLYRALLQQTGLNAPVASVLDNTFASGLTWARGGTGSYYATAGESISATDTMVFFGAMPSASGTIEAAATVANVGAGQVQVGTAGVDYITGGASVYQDSDIGSASNPWPIQVWKSPGVLGESTGVKIYRVIVAQSGTSAPTATVLGNSLGGTPTFARSAAGQYTITLAGAFTSNKTFIKISGINTVANDKVVACWWVDSSTLALRTGSLLGGYSDAVIGSAGISLEVLVYP